MNLSAEEKKEAKRLYDIEYRRKNKQLRREKGRIYEATPAGRAMQKRARDKQKDYHLNYCRTPKYREWKGEYDETHLAKKHYGEYWESAIILKKLECLVRKRIPKNERRYYVRNKDKMNESRKQKRILEVVEQINSGEVGLEILRRNWLSDTKELLKEIVLSKTV